MILPEVVLSLMFVGLLAYALFGGADFGAGIWDLLAGGSRRGGPQRELIERSIAPVWEANHVWLIFVLVVLWTAFPPAFVAVVTTLYIPLTLAAFGMIARGAAFAFRKSISTLGMRRFLGAGFALSSLATPYFLGAVVGGVASGRVPPGIAAGDVLSSWLNPTSTLGGVLAVLVCAYLAAVFLCADARREGAEDLVAQFRLRALGTAAVTGAVGVVGLFVLRADAPVLFDRLTGRAAPVVALSVVAGLTALVLLLRRRYVAARAASGLAVSAILIGWAAAQYPYVLLPYLTIDEAAGGRATLVAMLVALVVGGLVLVPSLIYLYSLFQRPDRRTPADGAGADAGVTRRKGQPVPGGGSPAG